MDVVDCTGGQRLTGSGKNADLEVVDVRDHANIARWAGLRVSSREVLGGYRDGLLWPGQDEYRVVLTVSQSENPDIFTKDDVAHERKQANIGRLAVKDYRKWAPVFGGRFIGVTVGIWTEVGSDSGRAMCRFMRAPLAGWLPDPIGESAFRYWNGEVWTGDLADSPP